MVKNIKRYVKKCQDKYDIMAPANFWNQSEDNLKLIFNKKHSVYFLDLTPVFIIHKFQYFSKETLKSKKIADNIFKINAFKIINKGSYFWILKVLRRWKFLGIHQRICKKGYNPFKEIK